MRKRTGKCTGVHRVGRKRFCLLPNHCNPSALFAPFALFALCSICTLHYLQFAVFALCTICNLQYLHFALFALCTICTLQYLHFALFALCTFCTICTLCTICTFGSMFLADGSKNQFVTTPGEFCGAQKKKSSKFARTVPSCSKGVCDVHSAQPAPPRRQ